VAFGSQSEISRSQLKEIAQGLQDSGVKFLWVIRTQEPELGEEFEARVKDRGVMVREWVDQREILSHPSVKAKEYGEMARKAMEEGTGSSSMSLDLLIAEIFARARN
ncbi:UDP-glycosyltransferase 90A2, partial [Linum perenne]